MVFGKWESGSALFSFKSMQYPREDELCTAHILRMYSSRIDTVSNSNMISLKDSNSIELFFRCFETDLKNS